MGGSQSLGLANVYLINPEFKGVESIVACVVLPSAAKWFRIVFQLAACANMRMANGT